MELHGRVGTYGWLMVPAACCIRAHGAQARVVALPGDERSRNCVFVLLHMRATFIGKGPPRGIEVLGRRSLSKPVDRAAGPGLVLETTHLSYSDSAIPRRISDIYLHFGLEGHSVGSRGPVDNRRRDLCARQMAPGQLRGIVLFCDLAAR